MRFSRSACGVVGCVVAGLLLLDPTAASAFKPVTHLWVAQQVLNDVLPDGMVSIGFGQYRVEPGLVAALRAHPDEYRMGHIGPDAFPDVMIGQMTTHPGLEARGGWPADRWLEWVVAGAGDEPRNRAFAYGYVGHAAGDIFAHSYVNWYSGGVFELIDKEPHVEVRHYALESYIADRTPPLLNPRGTRIEPGDSLATPTRFVRDRLIFSDSVNEQYRRLPLKLGIVLNQMYKLYENAGHLERELDASLTREDPRERELRLHAEAAAVRVQRLAARQRAGSPGRVAANTNPRTRAGIVHLAAAGSAHSRESLRTPATLQRTVRPFGGRPDGAWEPVAAPRTREARARSELARATAEADSLSTLLDAHRAARQAEVREAVALVRAWRGDILAAAEEYIAMSHRVMVRLLQHRSPQDEVTRWLACWGYVLGKLPQPVGSATCKLHGNRAAEPPSSAKALSAVQLVLDPGGKIAGALATMRRTLVEAGMSVVKLVLPGELNALLALLAAEVDSVRLTELFSTPTKLGTLLTIPDMAARVNREMHLDGSRLFDPDRFPPAHNAVVLAKLSLLGPEELNRLVREHGGPTTTEYGELLYTAQPGRPFNVLFGAVRSLDGSEQWQEYARGHLRDPKRSDAGRCDPADGTRRFGYGFSREEGLGMRLWADEDVRRTVFNRIFIGPLNPGLDTPGNLGFSNPVPPDYPFVLPTDTVPFPRTQCRS